MAITSTEIQVEWATADSKSVGAGNTELSDSAAIEAAAFIASVTLKADNNGTPSSDGQVTFEISYTTGDPDVDPDSADEYDTALHTTFLATLDTYLEDPAIKTVPINAAVNAVKIQAVNLAATDGITVSAQILTKEG